MTETVQRWRNFSFLENLFGKNSLYRSDYSSNNHFMYWNNGLDLFPSHLKDDNEGKQWINPTEKIYLTFRDWLEFAIRNYDQEYPLPTPTLSPTPVTSTPPPSTTPSIPPPSSLPLHTPAAGYKYFRVSEYENSSSSSSLSSSSSSLSHELPIFSHQKSFFIIQPEAQEGIHCRFCKFESLLVFFLVFNLSL